MRRFHGKRERIFRHYLVQIIEHSNHVQVIDYDDYISKLRHEGEWGCDLEITTLSRIFN